VALTAGEGLLQTGKVFNAEMQLTEAGTYEYRFKFRDAHGAATGAPTRWQAGPTLEGAATAQIVSAMAAQTPHGGAQVVVALAGEAAVTARVLNVAGREVRTIARDRTLPAGVTSLLWDGRSDAGLPVPAGTYLIHLEAADRNGARSRAVAALVLRR